MATCASCGTNNVEGTKFCVSCGATLAPAPAPESWRVSGDLNNQQPPADAYNPTGGYTPQTPPPNYPAYNAGQNMMPGQQQHSQQRQPMHPAIPAIVSLFFPGLGLLFVPEKAGLGVLIFCVVLVWNLFVIFLSAFLVGLCLVPISFILSIAAAIHSYDMAAKVSNGEFQPIFFK